MKLNFLNVVIVIFLGLLICGSFYYLRSQSMQSLALPTQTTKEIPTSKPENSTPLLEGQFTCSINLPSGSPIAVQISQGTVHGSLIAKSGDHIEAVFSKNILYVWDQEKQQGTKYTNVANIILQMLSQNNNACKKTTFSDKSLFTVPTSVTFKEDSSNNPLNLLQSLQ